MSVGEDVGMVRPHGDLFPRSRSHGARFTHLGHAYRVVLVGETRVHVSPWRRDRLPRHWCCIDIETDLTTAFALALTFRVFAFHLSLGVGRVDGLGTLREALVVAALFIERTR